MRLKSLLILSASLALVACGTVKPISPPSSDLGPTSPEVLAPAALVAPGRAEPTMPAGLSVEAFLGFLTVQMGEDKARAWWEWFTVSYPDWARDGWGRLDDARASFRLTQPSGPP